MRDNLINSFNISNPTILENHSRNTNENAKYVAQIIREQHYKTVLLVTQAYHMRRAMMLFNNNAIYPIAAPTNFTYSDRAKTKELMFVPDAQAEYITARTLHEIFGYYLYKFDYAIEGGTKQFLDYL